MRAQIVILGIDHVPYAEQNVSFFSPPWRNIRLIITLAEEGVLTSLIRHYNTREK